MTFLGVDIAAMDGNRNIDWAKARAAGVSFAYLRASYSTLADPTYHAEAQRARDAGIRVGPYFFPDEGVNGKPIPVQVAAFAALTVTNEKPGDLPVAFDVEYARGVAGTGRSRKELLELVVKIAAEMRAAVGYWPVMYSSARVIDGQDTDALDATHSGVDITSLKNCPFWCSRYVTGYHKAPVTAGLDALPWPPLPRYLGDSSNVWIRQTQGDSIGLSGFTNTVDINVFYPLRKGSTGARVAWLQRKIGLLEGTTGLFNDVVEDALKVWQAHAGLTADGIVGPASFALLARV